MKRISAFFFRTAAGGEPVRDWLKGLTPVSDRTQVGMDIALVEFGWPIGMPVCKPLKDGLFEVRSSLANGRSARVIFCIDSRQRMVLLHGFVKKTQKTSVGDLDLARRNQQAHEAWMRRTYEKG